MRKKTIFIFILFYVALTAVQAQTDMQTVATVRLLKSEPITVKQLKAEVQKVEKLTGRSLSLAQRKEVLEMMINERLVLQAAERDRITASDADVNQQLQQIRTALAQALGHSPTDAEFSRAIMDQTGLDLPAYRAQGKKELTLQKYMYEKKRTLFESVKQPSKSEIQQAYDISATTFTRDDTIQLSALVFPYKTDAEKTKIRDGANRVSREINGNANTFDEKHKSVASDGLYQTIKDVYLPKNQESLQQVGQSFLDSVFVLDQGKVSGVLDVPSERSFWIVKVTGKYSRKFLTLDDVVLGQRLPPDGRDATVRDIVLNGLMMQQQQKVLQQAQQELVDELRKGNPFTINEQYLDYK